MIRIRETENEYLLFISPDQKERARGIQGRKWDKQRVCWVYPRNVRMYNALVSEFGDDLTPDSPFTTPQSFPQFDFIHSCSIANDIDKAFDDCRCWFLPVWVWS